MNNFTQTIFTNRKNPFKKFVAFCCILLVSNLSFGQIASWPLTANGNPTGVNANATATAFDKGTGVSVITYAATGAFASGWSTGALDLADYFEIAVAPNATYTMNVTQLNFSERRSGTGIRDYQVRWSLDNFSTSTTIATVNVPDNDLERTGNITGLNINVNSGQTLRFRFYGYTSEAAGGTWRINDATLNVVGTVNLSAPTINGTIAAGEYGVHTNGSNQQGNTYLTWDDNNLYVAVASSNTAEAFVLYLDKDPQIPVNGGTNANGTNVGFNYDNTSFAELQYRADLVLYVKNNYREYRTADGSNGWTGPTSGFGSYAETVGNTREFSIPWSAIGGKPAAFNFFSYITSGGGFVFGQTPTENAGGNIGTGARYSRYYTVSSTTSGSSTLPFSRNSYVFNSASDVSSFGPITAYDFTMNTSGRFISRTGNTVGNWVINGNLVVGNGTIFLGSGGGSYGTTSVAGNLNLLGGSFSMDQTNAAMSVTGNVSIASGASLLLSGTSGGDFSLAGNWSNSGTFTHNSRVVTFNGTTAQTLTGATTFDFLTLNNTAGLTLNNSVVVNQTLGLTSGKITLGANDLTVGSAGTITGASATNYVVTNGGGQLKRTVGASNTLFAVGNASYNPITLNNSGTSDVYGIIAVDGTFATPIDFTRIVNRRWQVTEAVAGGSNLAIEAQYNSGEPAANFVAATTPYLGYYNGSVWSQVEATLSGANPFVATSSVNSTPSDLTTGTNYFAIGKDAAFIALPATQFVITSIAPATPQVGSGFNVTVQAQNAFNVAANVTANTSFTLTTNGNAGAISGTITGTILEGTNSIVVSGVILATTGIGATVTATQTSGDQLTAGTSAAFNVVEGADHLTFVGVPATGYISTNLASFTVEARRPDNSVDTGYTANVTIAKASGPGNLGGTVTVAAVAGVATFNAAQFDAVGSYTLTTTSGVLTPDTSGTIGVSLLPTVIAQFDFTPNTLPTATQVTLKDTNVSVTDFAISSGILSVGVTTGTNFPNEPFVEGTTGYTSTTQAGSKNFNFTINANTGYKIEVTSLEFNSLSTAAGPSAISFDIASGLSTFTANTPSAILLPVNQTVSSVNNLTTVPVLIQGWLNGSRTSSGAGNFRIDDVIVKGYVTCVHPVAYAVTGGGNGCATTGVVVGLANSQVGVSYQLKIGGTNTGSPVAGTGSAISFGNQLVAGTYTVEASNTNGTCNLTLAMTGSVVVTLVPASVAGTVSADQTICENTQPTDISLIGNTGTIKWQSSPDNITFTDISGETAATLAGATIGNLTTTTYFRAVVTSGACASATSAVVTITVTPSVAASVSIAAVPSGVICSGTSVTFTATPTNGGITPTYQWRVNGSDISGETASTFTTSTLANGNVVTVVMISNANCVTGSPATSAGITMQVSNLVGYANLQFPPSGTICQGGTYTVYGQVFQAGVTPGAGAGSGITVEFGYDTANTNPATWTNWFTTGYGSDVGNNDEYVYNFTPSLNGVYYYTFRYKSGACDWQYGGYSGSGGGFWNGTTNVNGVLTVNTNAAHTISLTSGLGTNVQSFCQNTVLPTAITYAVGGGATGAGVTGLPAGMSGTFNTGVFTISGIPSAGGVFNYTVTTTGNGCATVVTQTGILTISSAIDYANLQFPGSQTVCEGASFTAYGQVFESGVTNGAGQGAGITVEFGYSGTNSNPSTWSNWFTASHNPAVIGNNDEYLYTLFPPSSGTFYYAFRYKQGTCDWQYGGYTSSGGGTWGGSNVSGVLTVNPTLTASVSIAASATTICSGASVTFTATPTNGGSTPSYQWYVGATPVGTDSATYTTTSLVNADSVSVVLTSNATPCLAGSPTTSNSISITVNPVLTASVSIAASATTICSGASVTFTATPTNGGSTPSYQWYVGATPVGTDSATYTTTSLVNADSVSVVLTSNATPCLAGSPATSNSISIMVNPVLTASVSIAASATTICSGASVTFTATPTNGGSTPSYQWYVGATPVGTDSATYTTTSLANADSISVELTSNATPCLAGSPATSNAVVITVNPLPTASISGNNGPVVCSGSNITFTLTGTSGAVVTYNLNGGSNATATLTGGSATVTVSAATATQTLNLISVTDGTCSATLSGSSIVIIESTTWDGTSWSNGTPTSTKAVSFTGNYTIGADFDACSISVSNNAIVSVTSGINVNLNGAIAVASGSFTLNNNANLLQSNASAVNTGNIIVKRQTNPLIRLDYTLWSSPVTGQGLYAFSPFTFANRFYVYDTSSNLYNNSSIGLNITGLNGAGVNGTDTSNVLFATGKGYLIRLPYNHPTAPVVWNGSFTGVPNNGTKTITLANVSATQQFNAVGNPYPSPIDIAQFATDNSANIESTLYFWRKTNNAASPSYCTWNTASATFGDNGEANTNSPNGVIQTGQGFFVEAKDGATSLEFNNGQRIANNANQFFRTTTSATPTNEAHRVWLNLTGTGGAYSQAVVGYFTNATSGADAYDSKYFNDGPVALNMVIGSTEYVIQGRPTPFQASDVVPLNYKVTTAGNYTFAINHVDGLFTGGAQSIYIKDNQDGSYHNLSSPYTFTSAAGTFANRFELVYQTALDLEDNNFTSNSINVIKQQNDVVVRTSGTTMKEVTIYDIRGRVLVTKTNINASETKINVGTTNQVLLVQVTTIDGFKATKKVVN